MTRRSSRGAVGATLRSLCWLTALSLAGCALGDDGNDAGVARDDASADAGLRPAQAPSPTSSTTMSRISR